MSNTTNENTFGIKSYGDRKVFVPMSIDQNSTSRVGYFFSPFKSVVMVGSFVPIIPFTFYAYSTSNDNWLVFAVSAVIYLIIYSFILRFIVFEERRLKKMLKNLEEHKISKSDYFWGIDEIDNDGVIHYRYNVGLKKAVIVKVCRGSTVGKGDNFESDYSDSNLKFVRGLLQGKFEFMRYSRLETRELPPGLKDYIRRLEKIEDEAQRTVMRMNIDTMSTFVKDNKKVISDYYVIYNTDVRLMKTFRLLIRDLIISSFGQEVYFKGTHILDVDEVVQFIAETLNVKTVNRRGYFDNIDAEFEDYGEVFRLIDSDGEELNVDFGDTFGRDGYVLRGKVGRSIDDLEKDLDRVSERENQRKKYREEQLRKQEERKNLRNKNNTSDNEIVDTQKESVIFEEDDTEYEEEIVYIDEDGNEIPFDGEDTDVEVIYVEETEPTEAKKLTSSNHKDDLTIDDDVDLFSLDD